MTGKILISLCVVYLKREDDLALTFPNTLDIVKEHDDVEICLLDYGKTHKYWNPSNAYNMVVKASIGEYFVIMGADAFLHKEYIPAIKEKIVQGYNLIRCKKYKGIICCNRKPFMDARGYDERFDLYGPEDYELEERLVRRGNVVGIIPTYLHLIHTPDEKKVANYKEKKTKREMAILMHKILDENRTNNVLVANIGKEWGT